VFPCLILDTIHMSIEFIRNIKNSTCSALMHGKLLASYFFRENSSYDKATLDTCGIGIIPQTQI